MTNPATIYRPRAAGFYAEGQWRIPLPDGTTYAGTSHAYAGSCQFERAAPLPSRLVIGISHDSDSADALRLAATMARSCMDQGVRRFGLECRASDAQHGEARFFSPFAEALHKFGGVPEFLLPETDDGNTLNAAHAGALLAFDGFDCNFGFRGTEDYVRRQMKAAFGPVIDALLAHPFTAAELQAGFRSSRLATGTGPEWARYHLFASNLYQVRHLLDCQLDFHRLVMLFSGLSTRFEEMISVTIQTREIPVSFVGLHHMLSVAQRVQAASCNATLYDVEKGGRLGRRPAENRTNFGPRTQEALANLDHQFGATTTSHLLELVRSLQRLTPQQLEKALKVDPLFLDRFYFTLAANHRKIGLGLINFRHLAPTTPAAEDERMRALVAQVQR